MRISRVLRPRRRALIEEQPHGLDVWAFALHAVEPCVERGIVPLPPRKSLTRQTFARMLAQPRTNHALGSRMQGEGPYIETVRLLFDQTARRLGLNTREMRINDERPSQASTFRRPTDKGGQLRLLLAKTPQRDVAGLAFARHERARPAIAR